MSINKNQILDAIANMSVMDVVELVSEMEKKFGVSSTLSVPTNSSDSTETKEEKTEFNVILKAIGPKKIPVIKAVRSVTSLGLKEAKDLVESAPVTLKENISQTEADTLKKALEDAGAEIEVK